MEILIPISAFIMIAVLVVVPRYFRSQERQKMADTMKAAIEAGQTLPPDFVQMLTASEAKPAPSPSRDLRRGLLLLAVAGAVAVLGVALGFSDEPDALYHLLGVAAFPGFIGLALIGMWYFNKPRG